MKTLLLILTSLCLLFSDGSFTHGQCAGNQTTVVLSLDGFRWDYPDKANTPTLDLIANEGVKAISMVPAFPTKTFPNHYTLATGLFPDHHGIVNNSFYDVEMGKHYSMGNPDGRFNPVFYGGEPIWITAQKQGVRTASFYWVGSDVAIQGRHPDYWKMYDESVPFIQRIDTIVKWLSLPSGERPELVMAYYHEPDEIGHSYGPENPLTLSMIHELDSITGILYQRLKQLPDGNCINFIVVSDHGMGPISSDRVIALDDYIPKTWPIITEGGNPMFNFYCDEAWTDSVYLALKKAENLKVWKASEIPEHLNYGKNPRTGSVVAVADSSWSFTFRKPERSYLGGTHGYDINNSDMHTIFYASGPAFKKKYVQPTFKNTDIYSLLAHLLRIIPAKTDGDMKEIIDMLNPQIYLDF